MTTMKRITAQEIKHLSRESLERRYVGAYNANLSKMEKLESYEAKIERLEAHIDSLISELNDSDKNFIELRKAYRELKKSIEK